LRRDLEGITPRQIRDSAFDCGFVNDDISHPNESSRPNGQEIGIARFVMQHVYFSAIQRNPGTLFEHGMCDNNGTILKLRRIPDHVTSRGRKRSMTCASLRAPSAISLGVTFPKPNTKPGFLLPRL
jgi:hypothetical protein